MNKMKGWKTVTGAILVGCGHALATVIGLPDLGQALEAVGTALLGIGIAGKINKLGL